MHRARAQAVADAVALAVVTSGVPLASRLADIEHAAHLHIDDDGMTVAVSVEVDGVVATAHARRAAEQASP